MSNKFISKRVIDKHVRNYRREFSEEAKNKIKSKENMGKIDSIDQILDKSDKSLPKRKVKVEKKDKGLYERTSESTILVTEDNKFMLND